MPTVNDKPLGNAAEDRPVPLYEHVKRRISEGILMGLWPPGTMLPGEVALAGQHGVAVGTVRRALADLTAEGMLMRRRKIGTVVTGRTPQHSLRFFFQYFRLHADDGSLLRSATEVLASARGRATDAEAEALAVAPASAVIRLHRRRSVDGKPVMHEKFAIASERVPDFPRNAADVPDLLYLHLLERYGIRVSAVRETLTAGLATAEDRRLLALSSPAAVLAIDEIAYDQAGAAVMLSHHRATTQGYCYINEIR
jgi:GntR family transcriptional regulator